MVRPGDIYLVKGVDLGVCHDSRPCLVLLVQGNKARLCYFSSQFDCAEGNEITLLKCDPEFSASGLKKDSYITNAPEGNLSLEVLDRSRRVGQATGEFKRKVEKYFGVTF